MDLEFLFYVIYILFKRFISQEIREASTDRGVRVELLHDGVELGHALLEVGRLVPRLVDRRARGRVTGTYTYTSFFLRY